jgi:hypothetical protein
MGANEERDRIVQALRSANQVEWDEKSSRRVRNDPDLKGLTPEGIKKLLIEFVIQTGKVSQKKETRDPWKNNYQFYYKAIVPVEEFKHGLFIEMRLVDDDADFPVVAIVNAHPQQ